MHQYLNDESISNTHSKFNALFYLIHTEMHVTSHRRQITVDGEDGTRGKVNIPAGELIILGSDNSYYVCLSTVSFISIHSKPGNWGN